MAGLLKAAPEEIVSVLESCNKGELSSVLKDILNTEVTVDVPGTIVEQFIECANNKENKETHNGLMVSDEAKTGDMTEMVKDICDNIKELAVQSVSESVAFIAESGNPDLWSGLMDQNSEFTNNTVEFLQMIPQLAKDAFTTLSKQIKGKESYIGLVGTSLMAATGVYLVYKLYDKVKDTSDKDDLEKVAEARNALMATCICVKGSLIALKENKEASLDIYSSYLENATSLLSDLVNDKDFANSPFIEIIENLLARMAAPYDEYIQDMAVLLDSNPGNDDVKEDKPKKKKKQTEENPDLNPEEKTPEEKDENPEGEQKPKKKKKKKEAEEGGEELPPEIAAELNM